MSSAEHYTPEKILAELRDELTPWVRTGKGELSIALDPYNFLELLSQTPAGWRVVLHWNGEKNESQNPQAGDFCSQRLQLGITANLGLTAKPSESLVKPTPSRKALLRLVGEVRDRVRGYTWPDETTGRHALYKGCDPIVLPEGLPLAGYTLDFELLIALPPADYRNT